MSQIEISRSNGDWAADAQRLLAHVGFVPYRNGFYQRGDLYVAIDSDQNPVNSRFVGLFQMRLNDAGQEMMHAIALVPWYGDGAPRIAAFQLLAAVLNQSVYGSN